ncbi:MAG: hypothetical protein BWY15_00634 [Firmicutes bacterium ADurb.Bin193]|nr:MAG: hypothetical protein BWY15_00634 [Firmicutes bacterium ADurb.Bin193]
MAFDGIVLSCVKRELENALTGGRIDKITQPERDEINILIRSEGENRRLLISASSSSPRIHLTGVQKESPQKAPMFCMLLRKHLLGGKITGFEQPDFERVIIIKIEGYDELGDLSEKKLAVEIMGRHSNIILVDGQGRVLGSVKHVDFTVSSVRQVLPGMAYEMPPSQNKVCPIGISADSIYPLICVADIPADKFLLDTFTGVGPLNAREIAYCSLGDVSYDISSLNKEEKIRFANDIESFFAKISHGEYCPVLLFKGQNKVWDFNSVDISQYEGKITVEKRETLWSALDEFYETRDRSERMSQKSSGLLKFVDNNIARCQKKIALQQQKIKDSENREKYRIYGDLLVTNLHNIEEKAQSAEVENFFDDMKITKIPLLPELSPSQNAQRYYSLYRKAKNAEKMSKEQMKLTEDELLYLESVRESIQRAESIHDLREIQNELFSQGYKTGEASTSKGGKEKPAEPHKFIVDGFDIYIGRNNLQNDRLTLKEARAFDLWFHVKNFPGSHTILKTDGRTPSDDTIVKVAKAAAYFSKAKESANVPVDYTVVKNVKKPSGAKPGMVIYDNYNTVYVTPEKP